MKKNVGTADRVIRFIVGVAAIVVGLIFRGAWGYIVLALGVILAATSTVSFCPLYRLFRFKGTRGSESEA